MNAGEFDIMARQEASHWWYQARRDLLRHALTQTALGGGEPAILDLASACGGNLPLCAEFGRTIGIDISELAMAYCKTRRVARLVQGNVQWLPFAESSFDAVVAFDIFEHLPQDVAAMREAFRVLRRGRAMVFNVPACEALFSDHDVAFDHVRRYSRAELRRKLESVGFTVEFMSHWSFFLFPMVYACRKMIKRGRAAEREVLSDFHHRVPRPVDWAFGLLSRLEVSIMKSRGSFPWGVSLYGVCRKPLTNSPLKKGTGSEPMPRHATERRLPRGACPLFQQAPEPRREDPHGCMTPSVN